MDKKIKKFKADYATIKAQVVDFKKKLRELKKEIKPVAKAAYRLYERGNKTMYDEDTDRGTTPKFDGLSRMMEDLEFWMGLDDEFWMVLDGDVQYVIECTLT